MSIRQAVIDAIAQSTDDLMMDKPCVCGRGHKPTQKCYLDPRLRRMFPGYDVLSGWRVAFVGGGCE